MITMLLNAIYKTKSVNIKVEHGIFSSEENCVTSKTEEQAHRYATCFSLQYFETSSRDG